MPHNKEISQSFSKRLTFSALVAAGTMGAIGAIRTAQHPIIHADNINTTVQTDTTQNTDTSINNNNTENTAVPNSATPVNDQPGQEQSSAPTSSTANTTVNNISENEGQLDPISNGQNTEQGEQNNNNSQSYVNATPKVLPSTVAMQRAPQAEIVKGIQNLRPGQDGETFDAHGNVQHVIKAANVGSMLNPHVPTQHMAIVLGASKHSAPSKGSSKPSFPQSIEVVTSNHKDSILGHDSAPDIWDSSVPPQWRHTFQDTVFSVTGHPKMMAYCNDAGLRTPDGKYTYARTLSPNGMHYKVLAYLASHDEPYRIGELTNWFVDGHDGSFQSWKDHGGDPGAPQDTHTVETVLNGAKNIQGTPITAVIYKPLNGNQMQQIIAVVKGGGHIHSRPNTTTTPTTTTPGTKTTPKTTPKTTNNNNNNNSSSGGGGSSSSGGGSSSSTGGSPSGNGNQQQGGNGNGTNGGGNGTQGNGNSTNGGGNGSPSNNPNNGNNGNNGQPNNSNPNNDNPNNIIVPSENGGETSNNNNIVPNGPVINNNDYILPNGLNGNGNDNRAAAEILSALINNEDRDNQSGLNRFEQDMQQAENNSIDQSKTQASESAAQVVLDEKGKNAEQIESMNASAQVQSITNSMDEDSHITAMSTAAKSEQDSYMDYLKEAEADANSTAANALSDLKRQTALTPAQRQQFYIAIQANEDKFIADAASRNAYQDGALTTLNATMNHLSNEIEHPEDDSTPGTSTNSEQTAPQNNESRWPSSNKSSDNTLNGNQSSPTYSNTTSPDDQSPLWVASSYPTMMNGALNGITNYSNTPYMLQDISGSRNSKPETKYNRIDHNQSHNVKELTQRLHIDSDITPSDDAMYPDNNISSLNNNNNKDTNRRYAKGDNAKHLQNTSINKALRSKKLQSKKYRSDNALDAYSNLYGKQLTGNTQSTSKHKGLNVPAESGLILPAYITSARYSSMNTKNSQDTKDKNGIIQKYTSNTSKASIPKNMSNHNNAQNGNTNNKTLPKTGDSSNTATAIAALLGIVSLLGASDVRKHKYN